MKRQTLVNIIVMLILLAGAVFIISDDTEKQNSSVTGHSTYAPIVFGVAEAKDYAQMEDILSNNEMIKDLPKDAVLLLSFYNFYSGEREWERDYTITKGNVVQGTPEAYDIQLIMHSKYLTILTSNNFCSVVNLAKNSGEFGTKTTMSKTSLLWKYKGMFKHRKCLGF